MVVSSATPSFSGQLGAGAQLPAGHAPGSGAEGLPPVYHGTVDATALRVCLLHDAWQVGDAGTRGPRPAPPPAAALDWLDSAAARSPDGLLRYVDEGGHGLANQGWKDSMDSVRWRDGRIAEAPIALIEAQAYAVEAANGAAALLRALGTGADADRASEAAAFAAEAAAAM